MRRAVPERGEVQTASAVGWQHGRTPAAPRGLCEEAREAWRTWMGAWFASFWAPEDLPGLRLLISYYDEAYTAEQFRHASELRQLMDTYGITPKGQQDRRWRPPYKATERAAPAAPKPSRYEHLTVVDDAV